MVSKKTLEAASGFQIALKGKAQADEKAQHTRQYVSPPETDKPSKGG